MAENCSHNMHNLYTPRGAQVRDALIWSKYINEAIELFAGDTDVLFASHHWPRFGTDDAREFLVKQRDLYRWLHDQTMRLANHGLTPLEIAERLELAPEFASEFHTRGYYGTVSHNVKAVYQRYLGWFDGNPANLHALPPEAAGRNYVEFMGGADELLTKARQSFDEGEFRWVAQVVNHLVFADPANEEAKALQADALEQLGYQAESGPWRNFYLMGAKELREGVPDVPPIVATGVLEALTIEQLFDTIGVRLNGEAVQGKAATINYRFTDIGEDHVLGLQNSTLHHIPGRLADDADVTVTLTKTVFTALMAQVTDFITEMEAGTVELDGAPDALLAIFGSLDQFTPAFAIVTP